jgi:hypothetical protein
MPRACPHERGTLALCSRHSPEGSRFALPSPLRSRRAVLLLQDSLIRIQHAKGQPPQAWVSGTLARCSGHSPDGSCLALSEPAPAQASDALAAG